MKYTYYHSSGILHSEDHLGWGWVGGGGHLPPPPHCSSHQLWMTIWGWVGRGWGHLPPPPHCSSHQLWMTIGGWVGRGWGSSSSSSLLILPTLDDHLGVGWVGCGGSSSSSSTQQPNFLQFSSETKLTSIAVCRHSLS